MIRNFVEYIRQYCDIKGATSFVLFKKKKTAICAVIEVQRLTKDPINIAKSNVIVKGNDTVNEQLEFDLFDGTMEETKSLSQPM